MMQSSDTRLYVATDGPLQWRNPQRAMCWGMTQKDEVDKPEKDLDLGTDLGTLNEFLMSTFFKLPEFRLSCICGILTALSRLCGTVLSRGARPTPAFPTVLMLLRAELFTKAGRLGAPSKALQLASNAYHNPVALWIALRVPPVHCTNPRVHCTNPSWAHACGEMVITITTHRLSTLGDLAHVRHLVDSTCSG